MADRDAASIAPSAAPNSDRGTAARRYPAELHGIQMLRGIAAAMVVVHHILEIASQEGGLDIPNWLVTAGASGVDIFFVISGCIMVHTSFRDGRPPADPRRFLARRVTRIYPIYWVCAAALFAFLELRHGDRFSLSGSILALLLLPGDQPIIPYSWTLNYEVYFYVVFALALFSRGLVATIALTLAGMIAIGLAAAATASGPWQQFLTDPIPVEFVLGMMLVPLARTVRRWPFHPLLAVPACLVLIAAPAFVAHTDTVGLPGWPRVLAWGLPSAVIVASFLAVGEPRTRLAQAATIFGNASYSVYLSHIFMMFGYRYALKSMPALPIPATLLMMAAMFLLAAALGLAVHFLVEAPLMKLGRKLGSRELTMWRRASAG